MLQGIELINCAKANAKQGINVAAKQSGYEQNINLFQENLTKACQEIGVKIDEFEDLITDQEIAKTTRSMTEIEIAPESNSEL
jgi:hypothetical protein